MTDLSRPLPRPTSTSDDPSPAPHPWAAPIAVAGVAGVLAYIGTWVSGGILWDGYDPTRQAISELFAIGAPAGARVPLSLGLAISGVGLAAFGWAMHVGLPGRSRVGPGLAVVSGVMTVAVVFFPCTAECPGAGTSVTDTLHVVTAGSGYVALMLSPLAMGWRVRHHLPGLARVSWLLGGAALGLFLARTAGLAPESSGLQQRVFNTVADVWYVVAAVVIVRRHRQHRTDPSPRA